MYSVLAPLSAAGTGILDRVVGQRLTLARYRLGLSPARRRNVVVKWLGLENPTTVPISLTGMVLVASNRLAFSIRRFKTNWYGLVPKAATNARVKVATDMSASVAKWSGSLVRRGSCGLDGLFVLIESFEVPVEVGGGVFPFERDGGRVVPVFECE